MAREGLESRRTLRCELLFAVMCQLESEIEHSIMRNRIVANGKRGQAFGFSFRQHPDRAPMPLSTFTFFPPSVCSVNTRTGLCLSLFVRVLEALNFTFFFIFAIEALVKVRSVDRMSSVKAFCARGGQAGRSMARLMCGSCASKQ